MNPSSSTDSSQIHKTPPPSSISVETIESSIQGLIKKSLRRQRWHLIFNSQEQDENAGMRAPWRTHLANFLESTPVHLLALALLLLDLIFTILELSSSLLSCSSSAKKNKREHELYHWGGIAILSLLSVKILALVVALGSSFFRHPGHVIDGTVVVGALVLEAVVEGKGAGLLVVVSLWRIVRVVDSAFELSDEAIEAQIEGIVSLFEALREENRGLHDVVAEKEKRIQELQEALDQCEMSDQQVCQTSKTML